MSKTFIIQDQSVISRLVAYIEAQDELQEVTVKKHHKDRSIQQNSLYWYWATIIGNEWGWTKEDVHHDLKRRLLVPIYTRDDDGYAAMIDAVRKVHRQGEKIVADVLANQIVKLTSTTHATVKQFTEYLTEIERDMAERGIVLPRPEDRYYDAMGIKRAA